MIWFKHFTGYRNDPKVRALREEFGIEGAAVPIFMVEIVAESLGPANPKPFLTYSRRTWAEFVGIDVRKLNKVLAKMQEIDLFEVIVENDGKITFGSDKILEYCDKYTQDLKRAGKIPTKRYGKKYEHSSEQGSATKHSVRSRKKEEKEVDLTATTPRLGADGPNASSEIVSNEEWERNKNILKQAAKAMGELPQQPKVVERAGEPQPSGNGKIPRAEGPEIDRMLELLIPLGLPGLANDDILDAWDAYRKGTHNEYALASALDKHGLKGQDRTRVYQTLGVV